ncbi:MOSC domain-containing protein [Nocardioides sp.]|uniref:MOSC domain-containing protein n=1 Tax=Nocardioides sp. TaxID=35761 RepID=UPI003518C8E5
MDTSPAPATIVSVNLGTPQQVDWIRSGRTAIDRRPVTGPVAVGPLGLAGDEVANRRFHGGPDKAVYAFAQEQLEYWQEVLDHPFPPGSFGENLTTRGLAVDEAVIGERWRLGEGPGAAVVEVASFRTPCRVFQAWLAHRGAPSRAWVRRFTQHARPGAYLRVITPGPVAAGDAVSIVHRPGGTAGGATIASTFRAAHGLPAHDDPMLPG